MPDEFCASDLTKQAILNVIDKIESQLSDQANIDEIYTNVCNIYYDQMNSFFRSTNIHPAARKRLHKCTKPFWNNDLQQMWKNVCNAEREFLKCNGRERQFLKEAFIDAQNVFDRNYRREERKFKFAQLCKLEETVTSDPKQFWDTLKSLGPRRKCDVTMEVYNEHGHVTDNVGDILSTWQSEYHQLYNFQAEQGVFDDDFYATCKNEIPMLEQRNFALAGLNHAITISEVTQALRDAKLKKSVGIDNLPNEILKHDNTIQLLHVFFSNIFESGITPSIWKMAIIKPIPKSAMTDPRLPLQYRGISLLSTMYKIFSSILNSRISKCAESSNIYADEQNGFRKNRSCLDHSYALSSIIRNRKLQGKSTYVAFIDMEKAFDRVDRNLLYYKLLKMGIGGKIFHCIKKYVQR